MITYILVRLAHIHSNGFLGNCASVLAHVHLHDRYHVAGQRSGNIIYVVFDGFDSRGLSHGAAEEVEFHGLEVVLCSDEGQAMAAYLGSSEDVDYLTFQTQMLKRDRERRLFGLAYEQSLADQLSGRPPAETKSSKSAL